jgi:predicted amidohydrolase YtcJ
MADRSPNAFLRTRKVLFLTALSTSMVASTVSAQAATPADLIVTGARIYTVDDARPTVQAFAVRGGKIVFLGSESEALMLKGAATKVLDYSGRTIIPGMVDGHAHLQSLGAELRYVDLMGTKSYEEVIRRAVERSKTVPAGQWIVGRGWDQNLWADTRFPTHEALSRAIPNHPVILTRVDGHMILVNAKAMEAAKVTRSTPEPLGGKILKLPNGEPSGTFVDNAEALIRSVMPRTPKAELRQQIIDAIAAVNRLGLTGVHDAGVDADVIEAHEEVAKEGRYTLRNYIMVSDDSAALTRYFSRGPQSGLYDGRIWIRSIKLYADGALGSRGAALISPYSDDPQNSGLLTSTAEHLLARTQWALRSGFQVCTHAIGDKGNRAALDAYEGALRTNPHADHRFRVEHAQVIHRDDIPRFAQLGVIPAMQASHQTSDMNWAQDRLGPMRVRGAYAWRALLSTGVVIPNGSDFPVEEANPLISFHSAVTRQNAENWPAGGWYPEQRMTREEALKSMTIWPAYAAFQEATLGSLALGKYADFVVLDQDIMTMPAEDILKTKVIATFLGGQAVYERK